MTNLLLAPVVIMALASIGMAVGAGVGLVRHRCALLSPGNIARLVVLAAVVALSWISLTQMLDNASVEAFTDGATILATVLGLAIGALAVLLALTSEAHSAAGD